MADPVVPTCTPIGLNILDVLSSSFRDTVGLHIWSRWICNSGTPEFRTWEGNLCILTYSLPQEHMYTREESRNNCLYIKDTPAVSAKA